MSERERSRAHPVPPGEVDPWGETHHLAPNGDRPAQELAAGDLIGRYAVARLLGEGGMGRVLGVVDPELGREVAAKLIAGDASPAAVAKFVAEARITGQLEHPNIVPVYELSVADGQLYYTMKQVRGRTLREVIDQQRALGRAGLVRMLDVFGKVCDGLASAHDRKVIHRDLKPDNVMVGEFGEVHVMDWGLAKVIGHEDPSAPAVQLDTGLDLASGEPVRTMDGAVVGTLAYMPPEQARGEVATLDQRADIYALGAILYHILVGRPPFGAGSTNLYEVLVAVAAGEWVPPLDATDERIPWELDAVVQRAMARDPQDRYASVGELKADIEAFLTGHALAAASYGPGALLAKWAARNKAVVGVALAAILVVAIASALGVRGIQRQRDIADAQRRRAEAGEQAAAEAARTARRERDAAREARAEAQANERSARRNEARWRLSADASFLRLLTVEGLADGKPFWLTDPIEANRVKAVAELARLRDRLQEFVDRKPYYEAELASARALGREVNGELVFESTDDRDHHGQMADVVAALKRFDLSELIGLVEARRAAYASLAERSVAHPDWPKTIRAIGEEPRYAGLELTPQLGLVPLGPDPGSGLQEFACVQSGEPPRRGADGQLVYSARSSIVFVLIPGGQTRMGADKPADAATAGPHIDRYARAREQPANAVRLKPYFIAKHELTQGQLVALGFANPSFFTPQRISKVTPRHPVEHIPKPEAVYWLQKVGMSLPTEAQWEHAARGGTTTIWWTGDDHRKVAGAANVADRAFKAIAQPGQRRDDWLDDGHAFTAPVGSFRPNPFGLHDTIGNVSEWVLDKFIPDSYRLPTKGHGYGLRKEGRDVPASTPHLIRGGDYSQIALHGRSASRLLAPQSWRRPNIGVRPARWIYGPADR